MSAAPEIVGENEVAFFFQTNERIPARLALTFLVEVERIARNRSVLGPDVTLELVEVRTGTLLMKVAAYSTIAGTLIAATALGLTIVEKLQERNERISKCVAEMALDHGVVGATVVTCEGGIDVGRDTMRAVQIMEWEREHGPLSPKGQRAFGRGKYGEDVYSPDVEYVAQPTDIELAGERKPRKLELEKPIDLPREEPVRGPDGFVFQASSDPRGAQTFIGRFYQRGDGLVYFDAETGHRLGVIFDKTIEADSSWLPFGDRISVRAAYDAQNRTIYVFEFYRVDML